LTGAVVRYSGISRLVRAGTLAWPMESWMKASLTARIAAGMVRARRTSASVMYLNWVLGSMVVTSVPILPDTRNDSNGFRRAGGDSVDLGRACLISYVRSIAPLERTQVMDGKPALNIKSLTEH